MRSFISTLFLLPFFCLAQDAEFVLVKSGEIFPDGAVATVSDITSNAVHAIAVAQSAAIVSAAAWQVGQMVDDVADVINSVEGIGYIRGYALDFGVSGVEANTNCTATIVRYDHSVSNDLTYIYSDVYVYFTEEPSTLPVLQWASSPRVEATWEALTSVATTLTTVTVGATTYDAYRITVAEPIALASAFFRVFAEATQAAVGSYLPVRNGIKVGAFEPLTAEMMCGTNLIKFVGGVRVQ